MKRVPQSEQIEQEVFSLLSEGTKGEGNLLTQLVAKSVQHVLQEVLEQEVTDHWPGSLRGPPKEVFYRGKATNGKPTYDSQE